ncbi:transposase, partial [Lacticaseibacillus manihotivorans]
MSKMATVDEHAEVLALRQKVDELETQLEWFRKQVFGQKSEHAKPMDANQLSLFAQQVEQAQVALSAAEQETHVNAYVRKKNKKSNEKLGHEVETI